MLVFLTLLLCSELSALKFQGRFLTQDVAHSPTVGRNVPDPSLRPTDFLPYPGSFHIPSSPHGLFRCVGYQAPKTHRRGRCRSIYIAHTCRITARRMRMSPSSQMTNYRQLIIEGEDNRRDLRFSQLRENGDLFSLTLLARHVFLSIDSLLLFSTRWD